jgi:hypothetical protein
VQEGHWQALKNTSGGMGGNTRKERQKAMSFIHDKGSKSKFAEKMGLKLQELQLGDKDER